MNFEAVLDGELLVTRDGVVAPFNDLQQRLNRKAVTAKMLQDYPAYVRLYDILFEGPEDLRQLGFEERRRRLEEWYARSKPERMDLSRCCRSTTWGELAELRNGARENAIEGLMLKRFDSALCRRAAKRTVVQVETRAADDGYSDDVCPAWSRQAVVVLFRLHVRRLEGGRACAGR